MKKVILLLSMLVLPTSVMAMDNSEVFHVGDDVSVALYDNYKEDAENGFGFHVLRESKADEDSVWLIYDGAIKGSSTVYDEINPGVHDNVTVIFNDSEVNRKLQTEINKEGKKWNIEEARILDASDLEYLKITKNNNGIYEISKEYSFLVPDKSIGVSSLYNYWTSVDATGGENNPLAVYSVVLNSDCTSDDCAPAYLQANEIASSTNNEKFGIRPVVLVKKEYILCNNSKPAPVDTGIVDYILPLAGVVLLSGIAIVTVKRKNVFNQI